MIWHIFVLGCFFFFFFFLLWEYNFQWFLVGISVPPLFINFLLRRKHYFAFVLEKFNRFMWEQIIVLDLKMIENVSMPSIILWSKFCLKGVSWTPQSFILRGSRAEKLRVYILKSVRLSFTYCTIWDKPKTSKKQNKNKNKNYSAE